MGENDVTTRNMFVIVADDDYQFEPDIWDVKSDIDFEGFLKDSGMK